MKTTRFLLAAALAGFVRLLAIADARAAGGPGSALDFPGTNSQVNSAFAGGATLAPPYTFSAWVYLRAGGTFTGVRQALFSNRDASGASGPGSTTEVLVRSNSGEDGGPQHLELGRSGSFNGVPSTGVVSLNQWVHVAVTVSATKLVSYFINDVAAGSWEAGGANVNLGPNFALGHNVNRHFNGQLDEVQIWNTARSQAQIQADMNRSLAGNEANLVAYYRFDEGSGSTTANAVAGGVAGTLINSPAWVASTAPLDFVVTNTNDSGAGSLRQVLADAAAQPGASRITFAPALAGQIITLVTELVIADLQGVTVDASPLRGGLTLSSGGAGRMVRVSAGGVTLANLTFTGGNIGVGGAIINEGVLTLERCTLFGNSGSLGGAIYNYATLALIHCTLTGNSAEQGGAIYNRAGATALLFHCTLAGNSSSFGGGIFNNAAFTLSNCIVAANSAPDGGADIFNFSGVLTLDGRNIIQALTNSGGTVTGGETIINDDPKLAPLADNGGPTKTMALSPGSQAIDAALGSFATTDQRGFPTGRDGDGGNSSNEIDIGAFELDPLAVAWSAGFNFVGGITGFNSGATLNPGESAGAPGFAQPNWNNLFFDYDGAGNGTAPNTPTRSRTR